MRKNGCLFKIPNGKNDILFQILNGKNGNFFKILRGSTQKKQRHWGRCSIFILGVFAEEELEVTFYCAEATDAEGIYQHLGHVWAKEGWEGWA